VRTTIAPIKKFLVAVGLLAFCVSACSEPGAALRTPTFSRVSDSAGGDLRATASDRWTDQPDSAIWAEIIRTDTMVAVGLRAPGAPRGVIRGHPALTHDEWRRGLLALRGLAGATVVSADTVHLPVAHLKVHDGETLTLLHRLPFVSYVEPDAARIRYADSGCMSAGESSSTDPALYSSAWLIVPAASGGADSVAATYSDMRIDRAWAYGTGAGILVGITDTGVDDEGRAEFAPANFASGDSYGRTIELANGFPFPSNTPSCSHGTRIAGLVGAPRNGRGTVGAAYRASIFSWYQSDSVDPDVSRAAEGIHRAAGAGARVIVMAWGTLLAHDQIADEIDAHYFDDDVLFVGAAGTCPIGMWCPNMEAAVFPASKHEVLAVTGANADGTRPSTVYNYGTKEGVLAYTNLATTGLRTVAIVKLGGSSGSTGIVGGIAALVRSRFPLESNRSIVQRLIGTSGNGCHDHPYHWRNSMVNASAAAGALCVPPPSGVTGVNLTYTEPTTTATYCANPHGAGGSYTYYWGNAAHSTSRCATFTLALRGDLKDYRAFVGVTVTDAVTGEIEQNHVDVWVHYQRNEGDPCPRGETCTV
jgi:hypothetical protein